MVLFSEFHLCDKLINENDLLTVRALSLYGL